MRRHLFAACGALAIAGVTMTAQTPSPSPSPSSQPSAAAGAVTVSGCLKPATGAMAGSPTTGAPGTAGATGTSGTGAQFMLTDAQLKSGAGSPTGTTGTTPSPSRATEDEYALRAESASVNLAQHLNHQVELTGRVSPASPSGAATTPPAAGTTPGAARPASGDRPTLTVTSIKMIAAECK